MKQMRCRPRGFTLLELMIAFSVLIVFFFSAYKLFTGGTKTAEKARWLNGAVTQLRNFSSQVGQLVRATSHPTTLVEDSLKQDNRDVWNLKILAAKKKEATVGDSSPTTLMQWYACEAERPPAKGRLTFHELIFQPKQSTKAPFGELTLITREREFNTTGPEYVNAGTLGPVTSADKLVREYIILTDVASISFTVTNLAADDPLPIRISVSCINPYDPKTHKETDVLITPNVPIRSL
jgi:prepilin-type N-terminal cleavage/methylation domain-containing protein